MWRMVDGVPTIAWTGSVAHRADLLQRLARTYLGPDVRFPPMDSPPPGYITHVRVDRVSGVGPWAAQR